jgi:hypothetical protein
VLNIKANENEKKGEMMERGGEGREGKETIFIFQP